jgi:hypothetical protein
MHETDTHLHEATLVPFFEDGVESDGSTMVDGADYELVEVGRRQAADAASRASPAFSSRSPPPAQPGSTVAAMWSPVADQIDHTPEGERP